MTQNFTLSVINTTVAGYKTNTMKFVYFSSVVLVCIVTKTNSEKTRSGVCKECPHEEYIRIKRAKYYSNPPLRFYNRPPMTYLIKGAFSFTPPPGYPLDDARQPQSSRPKVSSSRHTNEGLGDENTNNIMRFLSKEDLDKVMEFGNEKESETPTNSKEILYERPNYIVNNGRKYESNVTYDDNASEFYKYYKFHHEPVTSGPQAFGTYSVGYKHNPNINELKETKLFSFSKLGFNKNQIRLNTQHDSDRVMQNQLFTHLDSFAYQDPNENRNTATSFNDVQEEQLAKPSNLREDYFEVSYTNNVPTVVKANSNSYKVENLSSLPLMDYHSKLESVDSYRVPHYTVTSAEKHLAPASTANIPVEPAPPVSTAKEQSDAHLKATKIWTHKSKGTAYTLHDDGTLSLEMPIRPKTNYGHS